MLLGINITYYNDKEESIATDLINSYSEFPIKIGDSVTFRNRPFIYVVTDILYENICHRDEVGCCINVWCKVIDYIPEKDVTDNKKKPLGREISIKEARQMSLKIMEDAERERLEHAEKEAKERNRFDD